MQYGAHCYLFTDRWSDAALPILDTMKALGLDLAELSVGDDVIFTPHLTRRRAETLGLTLVLGPGGAWPLSADLSADTAEERRIGLTWHCRQVDLAAEVGAVAYAGALYGHPGVVKRRRPPVDEYAWTAEGLHTLAEYAAARGVKIVLEPMSHFRTHVANTAAQMMRLIDLADHANLYALFDTYHAITEERNYAAAIRTLASRLWCVHTCENDRGVPGGGLVPWDVVFDSLCEVGYAGPLTMEAYNSSIDDFAFQRGMFHNVCPDGADFVRTGLAFLQAQVARRSFP
ncbi:MAG TPA: hypothetical protein DCL15_16075 [Chloroflexi bacterium]|nr:hypothetical protein [Chloroflexota bacterium]HHW86525.1 sugar phosphate isomerase/epimerase [Chloroflexota bacterium]